MNQLIESPTLGPAFRFGAGELRSVLAAHWWLYAGLLVAMVYAANTLTDSPALFASTCLLWIAQIAATIATTRAALPGFRATPAILFGMTAAALPMLVAEALDAFAPAAGKTPAITALLVAAIFLFLWAGIKVCAAPALCALGFRNAEEAIATSWKFVSGDMWWRILGLYIVTGLLCVAPARIIASLAEKLLGATPGVETASAVLVSAAMLVSSVWASIAIVALFTASQKEPGRNPSAVAASRR